MVNNLYLLNFVAYNSDIYSDSDLLERFWHFEDGGKRLHKH